MPGIDPLRRAVRERGLRSVLHLARLRFCEKRLRTFNRRFRRMQAAPQELEAQRQHQPGCGLISVVIPVWNTRPEWLTALAGSLSAQTLTHWEAVFCDGAGTDPGTAQVLAALPGMDRRFRVIRLEENLGISGNTNAAIAAAKGEWIAFCDHDDLLEPDALWRMAEALERGVTDVCYSDEDRITPDGRMHFAPAFKPDWHPDDLTGCNYICHLTVIRRSLIEQAGGLRSAFDGSQDHDLLLRCAGLKARFTHIPRILYHWRDTGTSMSHQRRAECLNRTVAAVQAYLGTGGEALLAGDAVRVRYPLPDGVRIRLLLTAATPQEAERVLNAFGQDAQTDAGIRMAGETIICTAQDRIGRLADAAGSAEEELLLLWDASIIPQSPEVLRELASLACRAGTGAASPQVLTRRGRIAFSGCRILSDGRAVRVNAGRHPDCTDRFTMEHIVHNTDAVSTRCVMVRRDLMPPLTDDISWSRALAERGLHPVITPFARAICRRLEDPVQEENNG